MKATRLMNTSNKMAGASVVLIEDDLLELEMQVAHRADELWLEGGPGRGSDLAYWMRAELEVMERRFPRQGSELIPR